MPDHCDHGVPFTHDCERCNAECHEMIGRMIEIAGSKDKLLRMMDEAIRKKGLEKCAIVGHDWKMVGGRACPVDEDAYCSQPVYHCARCGEDDYGDPGGPAHAECEKCRAFQDAHPIKDLQPAPNQAKTRAGGAHA